MLLRARHCTAENTEAQQRPGQSLGMAPRGNARRCKQKRLLEGSQDLQTHVRGARCMGRAPQSQNNIHQGRWTVFPQPEGGHREAMTIQHREGGQVAQGHTARKRQSPGANPKLINTELHSCPLFPLVDLFLIIIALSYIHPSLACFMTFSNIS